MTTGRNAAFRPLPWYAARGLLDQSAAADEAAAVGERVDLDARARVGRVDEPAATDIEADVAEAVEEDKVAESKRAARDFSPALELRPRIVRQRDPEVGVDEACEARAVEAGARRRAAVHVANADEPRRVTHDAHAQRRRLRSAPD